MSDLRFEVEAVSGGFAWFLRCGASRVSGAVLEDRTIAHSPPYPTPEAAEAAIDDFRHAASYAVVAMPAVRHVKPEGEPASG